VSGFNWSSPGGLSEEVALSRDPVIRSSECENEEAPVEDGVDCRP
jgi:hypothetical protein